MMVCVVVGGDTFKVLIVTEMLEERVTLCLVGSRDNRCIGISSDVDNTVGELLLDLVYNI